MTDEHDSHIPNGTTQAQLFLLRSRARTADIQRRSRNLQTNDLSQEVVEQAQTRVHAHMHRERDIKLANIFNGLLPYAVKIQATEEAMEKTIDTQSGMSDNPDHFITFYKDLFKKLVKQNFENKNQDPFGRIHYEAWARGIQDRVPTQQETQMIAGGGSEETDNDPRMQKVSTLRVNNARETLTRKAIMQVAIDEAIATVIGRWADKSATPSQALEQVKRQLGEIAQEGYSRRMADEDLITRWKQWYEKTQLMGVEDVYPNYGHATPKASGPRGM